MRALLSLSFIITIWFTLCCLGVKGQIQGYIVTSDGSLRVENESTYVKGQIQGYIVTSDGRLYEIKVIDVVDEKIYNCFLERKYQVENGILSKFLIRDDSTFSFIYVISQDKPHLTNGEKLIEGKEYNLRFQKYATFTPWDAFDWGPTYDLLLGGDIISFTHRYANDISIYTCLDFACKQSRMNTAESRPPTMDMITFVCQRFIKSIVTKENSSLITSFIDTIQLEKSFSQWSTPLYERCKKRYNHIPRNPYTLDKTSRKFFWEKWEKSKGYWAGYLKYIHAQWYISDSSALNDLRITNIQKLYDGSGISTYRIDLQVYYSNTSMTPTKSLIIGIRWSDCRIVAINRRNRDMILSNKEL